MPESGQPAILREGFPRCNCVDSNAPFSLHLPILHSPPVRYGAWGMGDEQRFMPLAGMRKRTGGAGQVNTGSLVKNGLHR